MQRRFRLTYSICGRPDLNIISTHLLVHGLSSEERKPYLKQAKVSSWQASCQPPSAITGKPREKRVGQCERSQAAKRQKGVAPTTTSLATNPYPKFNFRYKFSLLVVGPTQSGKPISSNTF